MPEFAADVAAIRAIDAVPTILEVICRTTGMGFAAVARVTQDRWIACEVRDEIAFGLRPGGELAVETTICHEIHQSGVPVVIDHVAEDAAYRDHHTPAQYGFQSYVSVPIVLKDGSFFGTLCAIDPRPALVNTPQTTGMFKLFAELIGFHLSALDRIAISEARLLDAQKTAELREQFIAVLGHDLRNPLGAIGAGADVLRTTPLNPRGIRMVEVIRASVARMSGLIEDVMDFARGRLGSGLTLVRNADVPLTPVLRHVIVELEAKFPGRKIVVELALQEPGDCDRTRIAQLLSNLVSNAISYGAPAEAIRVTAQTRDGFLELSVANGGDPIPPEAMERLFQPFTRGAVRPTQQGLGLGLFIASEVARAHRGTLGVESTAKETRFTFRMPLV